LFSYSRPRASSLTKQEAEPSHGLLLLLLLLLQHSVFAKMGFVNHPFPNRKPTRFLQHCMSFTATTLYVLSCNTLCLPKTLLCPFLQQHFMSFPATLYVWPEPYKYTVYDRYLMISLPKIPYIHRIYMVLANPKHFMFAQNIPCASPLSNRMPSLLTGCYCCSFWLGCLGDRVGGMCNMPCCRGSRWTHVLSTTAAAAAAAVMT
jgi:hypothetical protein